MSDQAIQNRIENVNNSATFRRIVSKYGLKDKKVLDIGCGHGEYLVSFGKGSAGVTTDGEEVSWGKKNGVDIRKSDAEFLDEAVRGERFEVFWANNLFEHLLSPHAFLMKLRPLASDDSILILGVPVIPSWACLARLRRFRGALASNHIGFYTRRTLALTIERAGWKAEEIRPFVFANAALDRLISPFAPHMYVVARNMKDFAYPDKKYGEWKDDDRYSFLFKITGQK